MSRPRPLDDATADRLRRVKRRDTRAELLVRRAVHRRGLRYYVDRRPIASVRSRADLVFPGPKIAVFVDGCFWHSCPVHGTIPANNRAWWVEKLEANQARDRRVDLTLEAAGWMAVRVWEHEDPEAVADRLEGLLRDSRR